MARDLEDFEDLYPDADWKLGFDPRPRGAKKPLPTVDAPAVYTLGFGVRVQLRDGSAPAGWLAPQGETREPFWWARRSTAERLASSYERLGFNATLYHATRRRTCTSAAKNPWESGYRASVDGPQCGASIEEREIPSLLAAAMRAKAAKLAARERAEAARQDARDRKAQSRARAKSYDFAPGSDGDVKAIRYLLANGLGDDQSYAARSYLMRQHPGAGDLLDGDALDVDALRDLACGLAADLAHSEPARAKALAKTIGGGTCRTAEDVLEKVSRERAALRQRASARAASGASTAKAAARAAAAEAKAAARAAAAEAKAAARAAKAAPPTLSENMARADAERAVELARREAKAAKAREAREAKDRRENARAETKAASWEKRERAKAAKAAKEIEAAERAAARVARAAVEAGRREGREEFAEKQPRLAARAPRQRVF
jgi:hypothetical protein